MESHYTVHASLVAHDSTTASNNSHVVDCILSQKSSSIKTAFKEQLLANESADFIRAFVPLNFSTGLVKKIALTYSQLNLVSYPKYAAQSDADFILGNAKRKFEAKLKPPIYFKPQSQQFSKLVKTADLISEIKDNSPRDDSTVSYKRLVSILEAKPKKKQFVNMKRKKRTQNRPKLEHKLRFKPIRTDIPQVETLNPKTTVPKQKRITFLPIRSTQPSTPSIKLKQLSYRQDPAKATVRLTKLVVPSKRVKYSKRV